MKALQRLPRRAFLRGTGGVALGLPWLDVFAPRHAKADNASAPKFMVIMHQANGVAQAQAAEGSLIDEPERFWPSQLGPITAASLKAEPDRALTELASHAQRMLLIRGIRYQYAMQACSHASAFNQMLTASEPVVDPNIGTMSAGSESIDYRVASAINPQGREPLTLMAPADNMAPTLSYRGLRQPRSVDVSPWLVYKRMMGLTGVDQTTADLIAQRRKSVNDFVREQLKALLGRTDLSREDRRRLDLHLSSVRDVEMKLACKLSEDPGPELADAAIRDWRNMTRVAQLHMDLIALACACDYSRVATLSIGGCGNTLRLQLPDFPDSTMLDYHQISHRVVKNADNSASPIAAAQMMHHEIDVIHAQLFRYLLDKLASYSAADSTLLDQGVAIWANELATGAHTFVNVPWIIAGSARGYLRQGAYVDAGDVTHNQLLNTLLNALDLRKDSGELIDDFGDPRLTKGVVDGIIA